jgi:hypothetical protein
MSSSLRLHLNLIRQMEQGIFFGPDLRAFANLIIGQAQEVSPDCVRIFLRKIAIDIARNYEVAFIEKDAEGNPFSTLPVTLINKLVNCHKHKKAIASQGKRKENPNLPSQKKKKKDLQICSIRL